jgi:hypothetical protein
MNVGLQVVNVAKYEVLTAVLLKIQVFWDGVCCVVWRVVHEHKSTIILRNIGKYSPKDRASHLRRHESSGFTMLGSLKECTQLSHWYLNIVHLRFSWLSEGVGGLESQITNQIPTELIRPRSKTTLRFSVHKRINSIRNKELLQQTMEPITVPGHKTVRSNYRGI